MGKYYDWAIQKNAEIGRIRKAGGEAVQANAEEPSVNAGLFDYDPWQPDIYYEHNQCFMYEGNPGFVRNPHTSAAHYPPFSVGTESLYGARPRQRTDGTYPYVYNMKAVKGMRVQSEKDGHIYLCYNESGADPLLYDPADVPAIFKKEDTE